MFTAEKRAALEAEGQPWPDCDCHGEPCLWQRDPKMTAGGHFHCRVDRKAWVADHRARRKAEGLCIHCDAPAVAGIRCKSCADRHADHMSTPKQRLDSQFAKARMRQRRRADQGFRPSRVGIAAVQAVLEQATGEH